ncbi:PREDICTED: chordin [Charadrius vociferus]|uniref:chordin n=1 Tax=Charadrius vociferus TaxID=50402 RepID=UPI0005213EE1|nr:PREDICTED: chordin [Charadrius vociferus]
MGAATGKALVGGRKPVGLCSWPDAGAKFPTSAYGVQSAGGGGPAVHTHFAKQRNRRGKTAGKVNCKNMKQDCPVPACPRATLLPGHCCHTCPKALPGPPEKSPAPPFDTFEYFQDKEDDLDKPYNDRSYLSSEGLARDDARTAWVCGAPPAPAQPCPHPQLCGMWRTVSKANIQLLRGEQLRVSLVTRAQPSGEVHGHILKHRALFAETFGAILTSSDPTHLGAGGMAMLTLSDTENNLHFILISRGLLEPGAGESPWVPLRVRILHQGQTLREVRTNITLEDPDFAEVLSDLSARELAQGVVKDLDADLLQHLAQGTAFLQVSTKAHPHGEMRGRVHIPNQCHAGGTRLTPGEAPGDAELSEGTRTRDLEQLKKDPNSCFFEGQHRAHGTRWAPDYDKKCSICSCQEQGGGSLSEPRHPLMAFLFLAEKKTGQEEQKLERARDSSEGCYFDGDKTWRGSGTRWHPVVPPFGLIKCAICTCKGTTGEVHCEKVQCPRLPCANPVRASPSDCCKQCPGTCTPLLPRYSLFGRRWYLNNESWHPSVPPFGEMKCILCWCVCQGVLPLMGIQGSPCVLNAKTSGTLLPQI